MCVMYEMKMIPLCYDYGVLFVFVILTGMYVADRGGCMLAVGGDGRSLQIFYSLCVYEIICSDAVALYPSTHGYL